MSIEAISWALNAQVGDSTRKLVLVALANHAHRDGTSTFPSKDSIAAYAECSKGTVKRHVTKLLEEGWIRTGDQDLTASIRADRRPVVYDLAMNDTVRDAWATGVQDEPPSTGHDGAPTTPRPKPTGVHLEHHGGSPVNPKPSLTVEPPPPPASGGRPTTSTSCSKHTTPTPNCRSCGTTPRQLERAAAKAKSEAARNADRDELAKQRAAKQATKAAGRAPETDALVDDLRKKLRGAQR